MELWMSNFRKPNILIESACNFNIYGHRIVNTIIAKFNNKDPEINVFRIDFKDFIGNHASGNQYNVARQVLSTLTLKYYEHYESFGVHTKIFPFETCQIVKGHPKIELKLTQQFIKYLKSMETGNYTMLDQIAIYKMQSVHSIRMYELLQQYYNSEAKTRIFEIDKLKFYLNIQPQQYENYGTFKKFIINTIHSNLQKHCNINFEFSEIKNGNKVIKLKFKILLNDIAKPVPSKTTHKVVIPNSQPTIVKIDPKELKIEENIKKFQVLPATKQSELFEACKLVNHIFNLLPVEIQMNLAYEKYLNES